MSKKVVLIADDEVNIRNGLSSALAMDGYETLTSENGENAWEIINRKNVDLVISDIKMPGMDGNQLLKKISSSYPTLPVIMLTGHGTIEDAVQSMQNGAVDLLTKPVNLNYLSALIRKTFKNSEIQSQNEELKKQIEKLQHKSGLKKIIGQSAAVEKLLETIAQIAPSRASVLICGESGVGKELVAQSIVDFSDRADKPFVKVHCAALNSNLLESELFGHVKGAFTGAVSDKKGRFEQADSGTIFLDEIGEIDQSTQIKLLRVLQEHEFEKVGGEQTLKTDVRLISATNRNLEEEIKKGNFREDLYYRLNVVRLTVPPLRERREDIPLLCNHFLKEFCSDNGKKIDGFTEKAKGALDNYDWPGNIRELRNCVESAVVMCRGRVIDLSDLPSYIPKTDRTEGINIVIGTSLDSAEKMIIRRTVDYCNGNKSKAAQILKIGRKTLAKKLEEPDE